MEETRKSVIFNDTGALFQKHSEVFLTLYGKIP
jgi:hypothetical protein